MDQKKDGHPCPPFPSFLIPPHRAIHARHLRGMDTLFRSGGSAIFDIGSKIAPDGMCAAGCQQKSVSAPVAQVDRATVS